MLRVGKGLSFLFLVFFVGDACILPVYSGSPFMPLINIFLCVYLSKKNFKKTHAKYLGTYPLRKVCRYAEKLKCRMILGALVWSEMLLHRS